MDKSDALHIIETAIDYLQTNFKNFAIDKLNLSQWLYTLALAQADINLATAELQKLDAHEKAIESKALAQAFFPQSDKSCDCCGLSIDVQTINSKNWCLICRNRGHHLEN